MFKFITSKPLWVNILVGIAFAFLLILIFFGLLGSITGHDKYQKVPSVLAQNIDAAKLTLMNSGFSVEVTDSVYDMSVGALSVVRQSPEPDALVKAGRKIFLTINRAVAPQVEMPNLVGFSYRSAEMYLVTLGLKVGDTSYRPDIARNAVLEQLYNHQVVKAGTKLPVGSSISFVLGSGEGSGELLVPDLVGLTYEQAKGQLQTLNINIGSIVLTDAVKDSAAAFIVKQNPPVYIETTPNVKTLNKMKPGQLMDLYLNTIAPIKDTTNH
ncbi:MAG: PASTA domain-containing protein [Bacteroidetes bacterium]|nr:PASTA domain-containing protein [Bacteroidota bacterium]MBS1670394.1 PASTA domain-containing protein [Bacteroidota bacterium]